MAVSELAPVLAFPALVRSIAAHVVQRPLPLLHSWRLIGREMKLKLSVEASEASEARPTHLITATAWVDNGSHTDVMYQDHSLENQHFAQD